MSFFYTSELLAHESIPGTCPYFNGVVRTTWWQHVFWPCPQIHSAFDDPEWRDFIHIVDKGYPGLAVYACLPVLHRYYEQLRCAPERGGGGV